jgi:PAS domain S-box-containing protein
MYVSAKPSRRASGTPDKTARIADVSVDDIQSDKTQNDLIAALRREIAAGKAEREALQLALRVSGMIGIWHADLPDGLVYCDENYARIHGLDPAETLSGKPLGFYDQFMHPDDLPGSDAARARMHDGSDEYHHEHRMFRPDGGMIWVLARGRLLRDSQGKPSRFLGVSVDITARKLAEARQKFLLELQDLMRGLTAPEEILRAAATHLGRHLGASRIGYGEVLPDDSQVSVTCGYADGVPAVTGTFPLAAFGLRNAERARRGETTIINDVQALPKDDREVWSDIGTRAHVSVPLLRDKRYAGSLYVSFSRPHYWTDEEVSLIEDVASRIWDAAARGRAETKLRASEAAALDNAEKFETFAQAMPQHVWTAKPDGTLDWFNDRVHAYTGLDFAALAGAAWLNIVHPDDQAMTWSAWQSALSTCETYEVEFRLRRADGVWRWHIARAVPIRGADGAIQRWIGTNTDIEEPKTTADALAALNATLERQVSERTAELMAAEQSLRQSQKMEAVGQLTGGLAHDFNNLLTGISGSLELLERRVGQGRHGELEQYLAIAQGAARRAASLTHRLLAFSRRQTLDPKPTDVDRLVADMDELVRRTVGPAITVTAMPASTPCTTLVDPHQLENALLNLCINARDAMPDGGRIDIETGWREISCPAAFELDLPPGRYVTLTVRDTGGGMTPDVMARAFDPFFTTKPLGQGTGLGLSMVYGFVRQSGGQARIESQHSVGTAVTLLLPSYDGEYDENEASDTMTDMPRAQQGETVLVVDDEPSVRMLVTEVLEDLGYAAIEAEDGKTALKILESARRIDLLITDVGLPGGLNGRQLADAARTSRPGLNVLFITGYAESAVIGQENLASGMSIIAKPFALEALAARIQAIISGA